ncbi:UNVERIFIED_CONTAM: Glutamate receptor 3.2 [Sesamum calycinum]|uniref:Glutamate receptor n=1 Tax=Sesamum calycinum TaxID=2727403 RepID=A0AAW2PM75_9LAMI
MNFLSLLVLCSCLFVGGFSADKVSRPEFVKIGSIFSFGTISGKVAKIAMKAAVEDVNSDPTFLGGTKLVLSMHDSNYSGFLGIIGGLKYMETNTVAIIGPQASGMAHILSHLANELHIPMLSFTALDPSLASLQYPYFIQTAPNDLFQMTAIADMISHFGYREVVVVYPDDEQNRGSITALGEKLAERSCRITYKALLSPEALATSEEIMNELVKVSLMESRVIIVNAFAVIGLKIFRAAYRLRMMDKGYVWIAMAWLSTVLDSTTVSGEVAKSIQGVLTFRPHTPDSERKMAFLARWDELSNSSIRLNPYGLYAYDTVWMIASAVKVFLENGGSISFSNLSSLNGLRGGTLSLGSLSRFDGGKQLLSNILLTNTTGLTGKIAFDLEKSMIRPAYDVLNVVGDGYRQIGYWSNYSGLSVVPPEVLYTKPPNRSSSSQQLHGVLWPGETTVKPRGWVFPHNGRRLRIGVPDRVSYKAFISKDDSTNEIHGYCVDVFIAAINLLPYAVPHEFILFGNKHDNPSYAELVNMIASNEFDAVVGDVAIVTNRTKIVDFTQPYIESGLVLVVPVRKLNSSPWAFLRPFTLSMWAVTGAFFLIVGGVIWILEHRINDDFRGPPKKQFITILWRNTVSTLGRMVLIIWLFVVLIITSSYTASLTSILTVQQLAPSITGIESLIRSHHRIGYQIGSFAENYLNKELGVPKYRLVPLGSPEDYAEALRPGEWLQSWTKAPTSICSSHTTARSRLSGKSSLKAFPRGSPLAMDMSTAILTLSENGELQKIHDKWLSTRACGPASSVDSEQLHLKSFWGLFLICGIACLIALLLYFCSIIQKFKQYFRTTTPSLQSSSRSIRIQRFLSFADEKEGGSRSRSKRKHMESMSRRSGRQLPRSSGSVRNDTGIFPEGQNSDASAYFD